MIHLKSENDPSHDPSRQCSEYGPVNEPINFPPSTDTVLNGFNQFSLTPKPGPSQVLQHLVFVHFPKTPSCSNNW